MKDLARKVSFYFTSGGIYYRCDNGIEGMQITKDSLYGINGTYATK